MRSTLKTLIATGLLVGPVWGQDDAQSPQFEPGRWCRHRR